MLKYHFVCPAAEGTQDGSDLMTMNQTKNQTKSGPVRRDMIATQDEDSRRH